MKAANSAIQFVRNQADRAMLFHSGSGKDSIALLDMMSTCFKEVICVYMYVVKDLAHINRYFVWIKSKYKNVRIIQVPHFAVSTYIRVGYLGCEKNEKQKIYNLSQITELVRKETCVEWVFYGFKKNDSLNRRLMLQTYENEAINVASKKCYPLSKYKNGDILKYIENNNLIKPECYGKGQSSGTDVSDINYLLFLKEKHPDDLKKVIREYPMTERILFEYNYGQKN